jgi:hypothetical protein
MNTTDKFLEDGVTPNPHYIDPNQETEEQRIERLAQERADAKLKEIKAKLDNAYSARDAALAEAEKLKLKEQEALKKQLEEQGKYKELYELQLQEQKDRAAQLEAEKAALSARNTELTRDNMLRDALKGFDFRNDRAAEMAYREIVGELIQDANGNWIHKSGVSIKDFAVAFSKDDTQSFLFKAKQNGGGGTSNTNHKPNVNAGKKLTEMSQKEVLDGIAKGTIKTR